MPEADASELRSEAPFGAMFQPVGLCPFNRLLQQPAGAWRVILRDCC